MTCSSGGSWRPAQTARGRGSARRARRRATASSKRQRHACSSCPPPPAVSEGGGGGGGERTRCRVWLLQRPLTATRTCSHPRRRPGPHLPAHAAAVCRAARAGRAPGPHLRRAPGHGDAATALPPHRRRGGVRVGGAAVLPRPPRRPPHPGPPGRGPGLARSAQRGGGAVGAGRRAAQRAGGGAVAPLLALGGRAAGSPSCRHPAGCKVIHYSLSCAGRARGPGAPAGWAATGAGQRCQPGCCRRLPSHLGQAPCSVLPHAALGRRRRALRVHVR